MTVGASIRGVMLTFRRHIARARRRPLLLGWVIVHGVGVVAGRRLGSTLKRHSCNGVETADYRRWFEHYCTIDDATRAALHQLSDSLSWRPRFTIFVLGSGRRSLLRKSIGSLRKQIYRDWRLVVPTTPSDTLEAALEGVGDHRIVSKDATTDNASGTDVVALIQPGDILAEDALLHVAAAFVSDALTGCVYGDEDLIDDTGERSKPFFKPDWDPHWLRTFNYVGTPCFAAVRSFSAALAVASAAADRARAVNEASLVRWDFALRACEAAGPAGVRHIPRVLCHRSNAPRAGDAEPALSHVGFTVPRPVEGGELEGERRIVVDALRRQSIECEVVRTEHGWRIHHRLPTPPPRVSIIIPTRDHPSLLRRCVQSLRDRTRYATFEIVIVDNGSRRYASQQLLQELTSSGVARVIGDPRPFNFSRLCNAGVATCCGDVVVLLNDDTEVCTEDWLDELVGLAMQPQVGLVGPLLLYPDRRIQHAGVIAGLNGIGEHRFRGCRLIDASTTGRVSHVQSVTIVTAACVAVRRATWNALGGLDDALPIAGNDVDLCLRAIARGYRNVWTPHAILIHHESASRGDDVTPARRRRSLMERDLVARRWATLLANDPAYNPNLTLTGQAYGLADPPRCSIFDVCTTS